MKIDRASLVPGSQCYEMLDCDAAFSAHCVTAYPKMVDLLLDSYWVVVHDRLARDIKELLISINEWPGDAASMNELEGSLSPYPIGLLSRHSLNTILDTQNRVNGGTRTME